MIHIQDAAGGDGQQAWDGNLCIASSEPCEWARLAKIAARIVPRDGPVAALGLGFGILARILPMDRVVEFFENEPAMWENAFGRTLHRGDFRQLLPLYPAWDVIVNDTPVRGFDFAPFLREGGLLIQE